MDGGVELRRRICTPGETEAVTVVFLVAYIAIASMSEYHHCDKPEGINNR